MRKRKTSNSQSAPLITVKTELSATDDLVSRWNVSADEAKRVYESWLLALKRRDEAKNKKVSSKHEELLQRLQCIFWMPEINQISISQRLHELADAIPEFESDEAKVSWEDLERIIKKPNPPVEIFRDWLVRYWIIPIRVGPFEIPLCICAPMVIASIYKIKTGMEIDSSGNTIWQDLPGLGLVRAKSKHRILMNEFERDYKKKIIG